MKKVLGVLVLLPIVAVILFNFNKTEYDTNNSIEIIDDTKVDSIVDTKESQTTQPETILSFLDGEYNLLHGTNYIQNVSIDKSSGKLINDKSSIVIPYISVDRSDTYYLTGILSKLYIAFFDDNNKLIETKEYEGEFALIDFPPLALYYSVCVYKEDINEVCLTANSLGSDRSILVGKELACNSIGKAINKVGDGGYIYVLCGTYNERIDVTDKTVYIVGQDKENCILISYSSNYHSPPVNMAAGGISNMSIIAKDANSSYSELKAYGIHVENHYLYGRTLELNNCIIESDFNAAVGMGLRGECQVTIKDCTLKGVEYGLFCHDSAYAKYTGTQELILINNTMNGLRLDSQGVSGATINVTCINNTITKEKIIHNNNGAKGNEENMLGLRNYYLMGNSRDNNIEALNAK